MSQEAKHEKERSERDFPFVGRLLGFLGLHGLLLAHRFGGLYGVLVSTEETVAPGEVLAVIVLEIAVVDVVMSSAVDELPIHESDAIVDGGGPDSDGNEQNKMGEFVHGDDVGAEPVGPRLCPSVEGVEREGREGAGKDKGVMQLVDWAVQQLAVQRVVDPVDAEVRDHEKEENRESPIRNRNGQIVEMIKFQVDFRIALLQAQMDGRINEGNHENRHQRRPELTLDLTCSHQRKDIPINHKCIRKIDFDSLQTLTDRERLWVSFRKIRKFKLLPRRIFSASYDAFSLGIGLNTLITICTSISDIGSFPGSPYKRVISSAGLSSTAPFHQPFSTYPHQQVG